jgi:hypothetical protein
MGGAVIAAILLNLAVGCGRLVTNPDCRVAFGLFMGRLDVFCIFGEWVSWNIQIYNSYWSRWKKVLRKESTSFLKKRSKKLLPPPGETARRARCGSILRTGGHGAPFFQMIS